MFYSVCAQGRPVRLCEATRQFALESLNGKYGDEAMRHWAVSLDGVEGFDALSPVRQYDAAIREIARRAPLRVTPQERVCGAATLGAAIAHNVPATRGGKLAFPSISHLTLGFDRALKLGVNAMEREIRERATDPALDARQRALLASLQNAVDALRVWHGRYLAATRETRPDLYNLLLRVPFEPPENFHQAVQALWFLFAFTRLCGNWPGIGRIDEMLGEFLRRDLASGALTREEAREILASLFIKGCEWIESETPTGSGDAQHYQNIVLGGLDETGREVTNAVSYLVVDIVEELAIGDFPITVRLNPATPAPFKRRLAEAIRHGGGAIALYGEPLILDSLMRFGYSREEALRFANDGCWEVQIPGKTCFSYVPFDALAIFLHDTLRVDEETPLPYGDFEELYRAYLRDLGAKVDAICAGAIAARLETDGRGNFRWKEALPCGVVSLFEEGCVENARSYLEGGPRYTVISPHIGGAPDVGNSLLAIDRLVYREKRVTLDELRAILRANWEGHEPLRQYVLNRYTYYGNDDDAADAYTARLLDDFAAMVLGHNGESPILFPPGVSTFGRQIEWAPGRAATPFGARKGDVLAPNASPTPGTDEAGATALIRSYCKLGLGRLTCGAALDVKLLPALARGENGANALVALMDAFVALGGFFMQIDIMDADALRAARENPQAYKSLSVRVSGWNARFVTLNEEWQNMVIERTARGM